jgi:hypothetical protein
MTFRPPVEIPGPAGTESRDASDKTRIEVKAWHVVGPYPRFTDHLNLKILGSGEPEQLTEPRLDSENHI